MLIVGFGLFMRFLTIKIRSVSSFEYFYLKYFIRAVFYLSDYILCGSMFENRCVYCIMDAVIEPMLTHFVIALLFVHVGYIYFSLSVAIGENTAGTTIVSPLGRTCWTVQLSY